MTRHPAPAPPYLGPARHHGDNTNKPIHRIVIHSAVAECRPGMARIIARYFKTTDRKASAHYVVDSHEVVQVVYDGTVAFHAPPNRHSIGIEMCDNPVPVPGKTLRSAARKVWRWRSANHKRMLNNTARLTAELCAAYGVPVQFLTPAALRNGRRGITTHANVSSAWGQTSHWDPGFWPKRRFMRKVRKHYRQIVGAP